MTLQFFMTDKPEKNEPFDFSVSSPTLMELQDDIQTLENDITKKLAALENRYLGLRFVGIDISSDTVRIDCLINSHQHTKH